MESEKNSFKVKGTITAIWILAAIIIIVNIIGMLGSCSDGAGAGGYKANTWYVYSQLDSLQYKNCKIYSATFTGGGKNIWVTYYPICSSCGHTETDFSMATVTSNEPLLKGDYCSECMSQTAVAFKIVY